MRSALPFATAVACLLAGLLVLSTTGQPRFAAVLIAAAIVGVFWRAYTTIALKGKESNR